MNLRLWHNCLSEAWVNLRRNGLMSIAGVTTVAASMVTLGALYLFVRDLNRMVGRYASETIVTVFVDSKLGEKESRAVKAQVGALPHVVAVTYVSKEEGLQMMVKRFGKEIEGLKGEVLLPAQVVAKIDDASNAESVAAAAKQLQGVERVNSALDVTSRLISFRNLLQRGGLIAVILLGLVALLTVNNTVHLTITARETEIQIMQLVGATAWYVRTPFLLEGAIQGFVGGVLALPVLATAYSQLVEHIQAKLSFIPIGGGGFGLMSLGPLVVGAGMVFGLVGSFISVRRLLHVG